METESLNDSVVGRRKSVRFSTTPRRFIFDADMTLQSVGSESPGPISSDENLFHVQDSFKKKNSANTSLIRSVPLGVSQHERIELTISPGTNATEDKFKSKIKKLQEIHQKRKLNKAHKNHPAKVDLVGTEAPFLEKNSIDRRNLLSSQLVYSVPEPSFSDISCIRASDTFSLKSSAIGSSVNLDGYNQNPVCSTPLRQCPPALGVPAVISRSTNGVPTPVQVLHPATRVSSVMEQMMFESDQDYLLSKEDRTQRQMKAMSVWCNMILRSQYEHEELDIGSTMNEARKMLQDLLLKSKLPKATSELDRKPFTYADFLRKQKRDCIREAASRLFNTSEVPPRIRSIVKDRTFFVRAGCNVHSDLTLQTTLLRLFLSFHPAWLHLGLETIFQTEIKVGDGEPFAQVISRFIVKNLFSDSKIMKNKKFAYGSGKPIITDAGREALHSHFLLYTSLFCYFVESAKAAAIIKHNPGMFSKRSTFKCMEDVFSELSREVLSGSGAPLNKAFAKIGFKPKFKQTFLDDYVYSVKAFGDLTDGVILGKTIELVTDCPPGSLINRLRDPRGDRLRKIGNVKICLHVASERGVDVQAVKPEALVSGNSDAILEVLWKLVGIYICTKEDPTLRRAPLTFSKFYGEKFAPISGNVTSEVLVLQLWREIGHELGIKVDSLSDLRDGMVFAGAWRMYNVNAPDIRLYPGDSLLLKVANAAESNLDVPWGLHYCMGLFAHIYLSRLCSIRELHNAALRIQRAYRSYKLFKAIRLWKLRLAAVDGHDIGNQTQKDTFILVPRMERTSFFETPKPLVVVHGGPDIPSTSLRNELGEIQHRGHILDKSSECHTEEVFCTSVNVSLKPNSQAHHTMNCLTFHAEEPDIERAVMLIQRAFRYYSLRKKMHEERLRKVYEMKKAATTIQRAFRHYCHRKEMREERLREWAEMEKAATTIQRAFRHYCHRKEMREERLREWAEMEKAATTIQRAFRHYCHRKEMREERLREWAEMEKAATTIQRAFRHYCHRKEMREERLREWAEMEKAATTIQRAFRHYCHRKEMREERLREWAEMEKAATTIQRAFRHYCHRKEMREERLREWAEMEKAATTIQRAFRHYCHRKEMREERLREWAEMEKAATTIQRAFRHYCHRKEMREERLREWAEMEKAATTIQRAFRHYCHRKEMREERLREWAEMEKAATTIQQCVRAFLARRKLKQEPTETSRLLPKESLLFKDTQKRKSSALEEDKFSDLMQVLELQYNVHQNERLQKFCSKVLKACGRKLSEYSENKGSITEKQVDQHCCVPSIRDQTIAAIKIQAWFRGYRERARLRVHLQERRSFMAAYRGNIAAEQPSAVVDSAALSSRPVLAKIHDAVDMLFDPKMYISKVGAFILNRLSALSPHLCAYMVVNAQGLAAILDILEQKTIGRGPPTANILAILQAVFLRIVECKHPLVVAEVDAQLEDCIKAALHTFHAFYTDAVIVDGFGRAILALYHRPDAKNYLAKASFYLNYATRRFNRLAETDPRKAILLRMKEEMSL